jgi:hypothetical protein
MAKTESMTTVAKTSTTVKPLRGVFPRWSLRLGLEAQASGTSYWPLVLDSAA